MNKHKKMFFVISFVISFSISTSAQIKDNTNQCDYLIITPPQFVNTLQRFVSWRERKSLCVKVVTSEEIYKEFPDSEKSFSIRNFVSYTLKYWRNPKPKYLLLVGGVSLLPSFRVESDISDEDSVSIDGFYSVNKYDSDQKPDIRLGRFPVLNEEELNNVIDKTTYFEDSLEIEKYDKDFIILSDKMDSTLFEGIAENFVNSTIPDNYSKKIIYAGQELTINSTRKELFSGIFKGTLFLCYFGHG